MEYNLQRNMGMACDNQDCHYWDDTCEQNCSKESSNTEPTPSTCISYLPDQESYPKFA